MSKSRRSSTKAKARRARAERHYAPAAIDFERIGGASELLQQQWGVADDAALREAMGDPERVTARLRELPALSLLTCEILIEAGGVARRSSVAAVLAKRTGLDPGALDGHLSTIERSGLIVPVAQTHEPSDRLLLLVSPAAEIVGERVWLASAVSPAPPECLSREVPPTDRSPLLALAGLALHEPIKHTLDGEPHRGNIKKHARRLAMDEEALWAQVSEAVHAGALRPDPTGAYVPDPARMVRIASTGGVRGWFDSLVHAWLDGGPRPTEVVVRALARHRAAMQSHRFLHSMWHREPFEHTVAIARDHLDQVPGLRRVEVEGVEWLARAVASPSLPEQVEGFVTPNLEVMIGPDPDPRIVARLALAAELVRIDRVLTFRLRPKTVARAAIVGLHGEELVDVLGRIGRHGLPDAVRAQVLDWSSGARVASAEPMTVLTFAPRIHDEVIAALGDLATLVPAPGVALVAAGQPIERIRAQLSKLGVEVSGAAAQGVAPRQPQEPRLEAEGPPLPLDASRADEVLRRKIADERAAGFAPSLTTLVDLEEAVPLSSIDWAAIRARAHGAPPEVRRAIGALIGLYEKDGEQLEAWLARQPPSARERIDVISALSILMLPAQHRRRLLASDASALDVVLETNDILARGWASSAGKKALHAVDAVDRDELYSFLCGRSEQPSERAAPAPEPAMKRGEILAGLRDVSGLDLPVQLQWDTGEGPRRAHVWIDQLRTRGKEPVVLVTEVASERSRVLPLSAVRSIELG